MSLYDQASMWVDEGTDSTKSLEVTEADIEHRLPLIVAEVLPPVTPTATPTAQPITPVAPQAPTAPETPKLVPGSTTQMLDDKPIAPKETNWADDGDHSKAIEHLEMAFNNIPKHSGETISGCERAKSYIKSAIKNEALKMLRTDIHGKIDEQKIEAILKKADDMIERLDIQIQKLRGGKKASVDVKLYSSGSCEKCGYTAPMWHDLENDRLVCMKCEAVTDTDGLEKTAGTAVIRVFMTPFEAAIARTIVNAAVSGGKDIEEMYNHLKDKYKLTDREELAIQQIIADMGFPLGGNKDRANINDPKAVNDSNKVSELMTNYYA